MRMKTVLLQVCEQEDFVSEDWDAATAHEEQTGHTVFGDWRLVPYDG